MPWSWWHFTPQCFLIAFTWCQLGLDGSICALQPSILMRKLEGFQWFQKNGCLSKLMQYWHDLGTLWLNSGSWWCHLDPSWTLLEPLGAFLAFLEVLLMWPWVHLESSLPCHGAPWSSPLLSCSHVTWFGIIWEPFCNLPEAIFDLFEGFGLESLQVI